MTAIHRLLAAGLLLVPSSVGAQALLTDDAIHSTQRTWKSARTHVQHSASQADARPGEPLGDEWSRTFKVPGKGSLDLSNVSGDIVVTGGPGDEIRVDAVAEHYGKSGGSDDIRIVVDESAGRVVIRTEYPRRGRHGDVEFTVRVPTYVDVTLHSVSGEVRVEKVHGVVRAESVSGGVAVTDARKLEMLKSVSGDVTVNGSTGEVVNADSVSGGVHLQGLSASTCELQSVSGDIILSDAKCGRAQAKTISGGVEYSGAFAAGGRYDFSSHSGDVRLVIGGGAGYELLVKTFSGDIRTEVPVSRQTSEESHGGPRRTVRGTVGDGSATVTIKTFSGSVVLEGAEGGRRPRAK